MNTLNKYIELIGSVLAVFAVFLLANALPVGWYVGFVSSMFMLVLTIRLGLEYMFVMNGFFLIANIVGIYSNFVK